jgi:hypothetical protein
MSISIMHFFNLLYTNFLKFSSNLPATELSYCYNFSFHISNIYLICNRESQEDKCFQSWIHIYDDNKTKKSVVESDSP